jgi:AraC family transcriptional regulator of adaptative response / DNA-3-methyladenine glycosylase II
VPYTLIGPDGVPHPSGTPGSLGGHRRSKVFGRLDCPGALRWLARGHYAPHRVFFADAASAWAAGFRPCATCLPAEYREWKAGRAQFRVMPPAPYDAAFVLGFLGARAWPGVETWDGAAFSRVADGLEVTLAVEDGAVRVSLSAAAGLRDAVRLVRRVLDLDVDPAAVRAVLGADPLLGPLVAARPGLRSPGAFDAYEVAVRAIVGQAISVPAARTILGRLPARGALADARPEDLPMPRGRASALIALAAGAPLEAIKGVGPWTRGYVAMRTGDPDVLLTGDLIVRRNAERLGGPASERALAALGEAWSPVRSYATHHLWCYL